MRNFLLTIGLLWLMLLSSFGAAQKQDASALDSVLRKMDETSAHFQTAQADFVFDQYQKVVDETDTQKGTVYYRKAGQQIEMMAEFTDPDKKFVLYKNGKLQVYQPKIEQVMEYSAGANQQELESLMVLGFGGSGQDLKKSYDVTYQGEETVNNISTAKLQLIPKNDKLRGNLPQIILWIDLANGISVQQKLMQTQGDYRLAKYSAIKVNAKINNDVFRLKTTNKTKFVSPRG
ncbi:MAG: outer membrane lipoprotein carrier protein LolA [Candidatus Sulfotelmatobacter sp.]